MKKLKRYVNTAIGRRIGARTLRTFIAAKTDDQLKNIYGDFHDDLDLGRLTIQTPHKESGVIRGELVYFLGRLAGSLQSMLLPGEPRAAKEGFSSLAKLDIDLVTTAGLHDDADHRWNFEEDPPSVLTARRFDCIVSQAILEHLIDPYKHLRDCAGLLASGGHLLVHTVMPGFIYHRHPVDCMRFYPDWFEEVGKRLGLTVADKAMGDGHIVYLYRKP